MNRPTARVTSKAPRTIQPVEFAEARAFEINAMEKAIYSTTYVQLLFILWYVIP